MNVNEPGAPTSAPPPDADGPPIDIRHLSEQQLQALGVTQLAYIKPVILNGAQAYAIHAADGTPMAVAADQEIAISAIRQHEMMPALVH